MTTIRAHWRELLVGGTLLVFAILVVVALVIRSRPVAMATRPATGSHAARTERPAPTPVFTVAPVFTSDPVLTATQALFGGRVVDSGTMAPLPGAELDIDQSGGPLRVHTDIHGVYKTPVETARPFSFTVTARDHVGGAGFGRLCAGDHSDITLSISPRGGAPAAPVAIQGSCPTKPA